MENLSNSINSPDDEAGERLVSGEEKNGHKSKDKTVEVKYMTPDSQNGDAKIDIENLKTAFAGMGKEELMKYANDPFWVKMRWFLFILFWLVWIAMLVGAIAIIVLAPKCAAPSPREWWEQSPLYQVDVRSFKDGSDPQDGIGDLKGLESKLDYLKELGVKTIVLSSLLKSSGGVASSAIDVDSGSVVDYKEIDDDVGTLQQFKQLADSMKEKGLYMLMSFIPNHSSDQHPWFIKSIDGEEPFKDFYVWASAKGYDEDGSKPLPPNNWITKNGDSAWEWNEKRKMFYLHQFDKSQPDFNFHNQQVVDYFRDVMKFWLGNGVSGFHLDKVQYLLEDEHLRNDPTGETAGAVVGQYEFLNHKYTRDLDQLSSVLQQWNEMSANNSGILSVTSMRPNNGTLISTLTTLPTTIVISDVEKSIGQLFVRPQILQSPLSAAGLMAAVNSTLKFSTWPTWEFVCKSSSTDCITEEMLPGLQVVSLMLPGTPVTRSGTELGIINVGIMPWDNTTNGGFTTAEKTWRSVNSNYVDINVAAQSSDADSQLNLYKKLIQTRQSPSIMHGVTDLALLNDHVFTFTRIKSGNPGYVIAFNMHTSTTTVELTKHLKGVPNDLSIVAQTKGHTLVNNSSEIMGRKTAKVTDTGNVTLEGYSAIVLQFVPTQSSG